MQIPLSPRLQTCCSFVHPSDRVADVGCDHGYLSIYLLTHGIASQVVAGDINEGPLQSAVTNAARFGVTENIRFFLSNGLQNMPRDFDTAVIAGMGADVMESILSDAPWLCNGSYRLILQCQSRTPALCRYLSNHGWYISQEKIVRDGRFLYTVMEVLRGDQHMTEAQCHFPPALYAVQQPLVAEYYAQVVKRLRIAAVGQKNEALFALLAELDRTVPAWAKGETT